MMLTKTDLDDFNLEHNSLVIKYFFYERLTTDIYQITQNKIAGLGFYSFIYWEITH